MTPDDLDLLERWYDGTLNDAARAQWTTRLQRDPASAKAIAAELRLTRRIAALCTPAEIREQAAQEAARRTRSLLAADSPSHRQRTISGVMNRTAGGMRRHHWLIAATAAAAACLGIMLWWPSSDAVAWADGLALRPGSEIPASTREVRFADGSTVTIAPDSRVRLTGDRTHKALAVERGSVSASVSPQKTGGGFAVSTPDGVASVVGTRFTVARLPESTLLTVGEGRVHLAAGAQAVDVVAGQRAQAAGGSVDLLPPVWSDRRPLGRLVLSQPPGNDPADRNGWLIAPGDAASFPQRLTTHIDQAITALKRIDAQGLLLYTIEGGTHQRSTGFVGDPRRVAEFAPEFDAVADQVFARIRAAGLATGITVSPWRLERVGDTWRKVPDVAAAETELEAKVAYAHQRWQCTLFYLNVAAPGLPTELTVPLAAVRAVLRRHPEILFIIEGWTPDLAPLGAAQALGDQRVRTDLVVRMPWFGAEPSDDALTRYLDAQDVIFLDPTAASAVDQIRRVQAARP